VAQNRASVVAANVYTNPIQVAEVAFFTGQGAAPSYTGDDRAIVFSAPDNNETGQTPTGASLYRSPLAADKVTPSGAPQLFLVDGALGAIYRRGTFKPPTGNCGGNFELCLNRSRFRVEIFWEDFQGKQGGGRPAVLTSDTGYFSFFDSTNVEAVVKVIDACSFSGSYWVFAAGLTNVATVIRVTDTLTGTFKTYSNALGTPLGPVVDTTGFKVCGVSTSRVPPDEEKSSSTASSSGRRSSSPCRRAATPARSPRRTPPS
jgi:hypothetical protein